MPKLMLQLKLIIRQITNRTLDAKDSQLIAERLPEIIVHIWNCVVRLAEHLFDSFGFGVHHGFVLASSALAGAEEGVVVEAGGVGG